MAFDDLLKIRTWSLDGKKTEHITPFVQSKAWSGSYTDCARQLSFSVTPEALCELGGLTRLYHEVDILFSGRIVSRQRDSFGQTVDCTAFDNGRFLKRNSTYLAVRNQTPEAVTRQLCREFGILTGSIAATGISLSRNFLGVSLYQIIQTMYTLASEDNGKKYQIRFLSNQLQVVEKTIGADSLRLVPGSNLLSCTSADSIEKLVTRVGVYDDNNKLTAHFDSPNNYVALYGLMQQAIQATDSEKPETTAKRILEDNGIETTITAQCIGSPKLITGNAVVVEEPVTGTYGQFWITADSHSFSEGVYRTKVSLDFRNLMDKQTAGSVPEK
ncbi:hypothetical protein [Oscillibacter sp. GMB15532]|uniref:XkdQ/YqbQ family protein n=1 Tax=Oscillibacter sp. GMB15532 TaxID=3230022 RepID=UPI0034DE99D6